MNNKRRIQLGTAAAVFVIVAIVLITIVREKSTSAAAPPPPPEVQVAVVEQRDLPVHHEWIGTLNGLVNAAINAEVTGYLLRQDYAEGSFVHKGQLLFEIDPRPFQAAVDQAAGQLAQSKAQLTQAQAVLVQAQAQQLSAEANQRKSQLDQEKYTPLFEDKAVTRQDLDNAVQTNQSNVAQVAAAKAQVETAKAQIAAAGAAVKASEATLETAKVNLGFTSLTSLIDGIAGAATVQVGNLVAPSSPAVTTVSTLDPIKAVFTVSEQEYLSLARADSLHHLQLKLILADGSTHPKDGRFSFADRQVDPNTGAIQMTALFPNPGNILRPGQYAMVRAVTGEDKGALLVPQPAVSELQGGYEVMVVDADNKVATRQVQVGDRVDTMWVITNGLKPGERVVVQGQQKLRSGVKVQPKPYHAS
ncbi:MAG TPA: efflux RND transporter periplasmic adaptor subunit [Bryobacteraceae bacterium]|jgi:RND family efflux transporter MFP subunit|nr:efflux RND transporter periplasmic adaptor subunit [Bryobacteraceae bacterium]